MSYNTLQTPGFCVEIATSNMNLLPVNLSGSASRRSHLQEMAVFLEKAGARNFEIHPTRTLVNDVLECIAAGDTGLANSVIGRLHQTFNNYGSVGATSLDTVAERAGVIRCRDSVHGMAVLCRALSHRPIGVHYPDKLPTGPDSRSVLWRDAQVHRFDGQYEYGFGVVQPQAEVYRDFEVSTTKTC